MKELLDYIKEKYDINVTINPNKPVQICTFEDYCDVNNIMNPTNEDHIKFNEINWDNDLLRFYDSYKKYTYDNVFETLSRSYNYVDLIKKITKYYNSYIYDILIINSKSDNKSFRINYKKDFSHDKIFKSLLFLYNYHIAINNKKNYYNIAPNKPTEKTSYIYNITNGIIYHITTKTAYNNIMKYGLKPRTSPTHDERIFIFAENDIKKLKLDIISMRDLLEKSASLKNKYDQTYDVILKIDLKKYKNKLSFYDDENVETFSAYWTSEYIPPYCITKININEL